MAVSSKSLKCENERGIDALSSTGLAALFNAGEDVELANQ